MSDGLRYILLVLIAMACFGVVVSLILWAISYLSFWLAIACGVLTICYLSYTSVQTLIGCAADPIFFPPIEGSGGEGRFSHACDGPGGLLSYGYALIAVPVSVLSIAICLRVLWKRRQKQHV